MRTVVAGQQARILCLFRQFGQKMIASHSDDWHRVAWRLRGLTVRAGGGGNVAHRFDLRACFVLTLPQFVEVVNVLLRPLRIMPDGNRARHFHGCRFLCL